MAQDKIAFIEVLADGTIKITTEKIGAVNHAKADSALDLISKLAGGPTKRTRRGTADHQHHAHHGSAEHSH